MDQERQEAKKIIISHGLTEEEADGFISDVQRGIKDFREGKMIPWDTVKRELGVE